MMELETIFMFILGFVIAIFYFFIANKILKKNRKLSTILFSLYFVLTAIAAVLAPIMHVFVNSKVPFLLNYVLINMLMFLGYIGYLCLIYFSILMYKNEPPFSQQTKRIMIIIAVVIFSIGILIAIFGYGGVSFQGELVIWSIEYEIALLFELNLRLFLVMYFNIKILKDLSDPRMKKKWEEIVIGVALLLFMANIYYISQIFLDPFVRILSQMIMLLVTIGSTIFITSAFLEFKK